MVLGKESLPGGECVHCPITIFAKIFTVKFLLRIQKCAEVGANIEFLLANRKKTFVFTGLMSNTLLIFTSFLSPL